MTLNINVTNNPDLATMAQLQLIRASTEAALKELAAMRKEIAAWKAEAGKLDALNEELDKGNAAADAVIAENTK